MDSNDTSLGDLPPQLQEIIQLALSTFIDLNLPSLYIMIIASLWLGVSLCLFMALLYSSHPEKRKTLLFICCVIAVGFGTVPSILFLNLLIKSFTATVSDNADLAVEMKPYIFALSFFSYFSSILVDLILLLRLVPLLRLPGAPKKAVVLGPLFTIKLGRIVAVTILVVNYTRRSRTLPPDDPTQLYTVVTQMREPKAAWCLQLADNALCSFLFVYLLQRAISSILKKTSSYAQRLRALFLIAASNFIFPVIFVVIELIFVTRKLSYTALAAINISGTNIEIIGILFATIWASQDGGAENDKSYISSTSTSSGRRESKVIEIAVTRQAATSLSARQTASGLFSTVGFDATEIVM